MGQRGMIMEEDFIQVQDLVHVIGLEYMKKSCGQSPNYTTITAAWSHPQSGELHVYVHMYATYGQVL